MNTILASSSETPLSFFATRSSSGEISKIIDICRLKTSFVAGANDIKTTKCAHKTHPFCGSYSPALKFFAHESLKKKLRRAGQLFALLLFTVRYWAMSYEREFSFQFLSFAKGIFYG
jgi:hypothetical protein